MTEIDKNLLKEISEEEAKDASAYNIRKNGKCLDRKVSDYINIVPKEDGKGIDVYVKENTLFGIVHIPVIITESGLTDIVYNDFHIGKNANVIIFAGCGVHNDGNKEARHDGIHRFYLAENAKVKYAEKHYGEGNNGKKVLNPVTEIIMQKSSRMDMTSVQLKGVDDTNRITKATLYEGATLIVNEKILTNNTQKAKTTFEVELKGDNSSTKVTSRSVATENSYQEFISKVVGKTKCYGHVSCDAIIKDEGMIKAVPEIFAKDTDANLIHEAAIGKIAGEQLLKLMTLGLSEAEAEKVIIDGFLR